MPIARKTREPKKVMLTALRDDLAKRIDEAENRDVPPLVKAFLATVAELETLGVSNTAADATETPLDKARRLREEREARRAGNA